MIKNLILTAALSAAFTATAFAGGDPVAGKAKAVVCAGCHGADGNSANKIWPKLAGQHASYLAKQLSEFKSQARKDPTMAPMVAGLTDADIANVSAYFASQKNNGGAADEKLVKLGQKIYRAGINDRGVAACASCHGPAGNGNPAAKFPKVAGQHAEYAAKTLGDFKSGARANDPGNMMRDIAGKLTESEIKAVASYMSGLK
jgi:cytochrome c553